MNNHVFWIKLSAAFLFLSSLLLTSAVAQPEESGKIILCKYQKQMGVETYEVKREQAMIELTARFKR